MSEIIYLDNAATTFPKPAPVIQAMCEAGEEYGANPGRRGHQLSQRAAQTVYHTRARVAEFFGGKAERVAFTLNATYAINTALCGFLKPGDHVVVSDLEHNALIRPLEAMKAKGISYSVARVDFYDDERTLRAFEAKICSRTALIACTHASNVWGKILPVRRIGALAHAHHIPFLVDASQSAGYVPIDMKRMHIDFLCMPGHKGLYAPQGIGMLLLSERVDLEPLVRGGTGSNSLEISQPDFYPDRLESGTLNTPCIAGLAEGIRFIESEGRDQLYQREMRHIRAIYKGLSVIKRVRLYTPCPDHTYVPVLSFGLRDTDQEAFYAYLDENKVAVRSGLHCAPVAHRHAGTLRTGAIRVSVGAFNTGEEVEKFLCLVENYE